MIRLRTAVMAAMGICAGAAAAPAAAQLGMGMIGSRHVDGADRDTIEVHGSTQYREIMICVDDAPLSIQDIVVRFRGGTSQNIRMRSRIAAGRCGRIVNVTGRDRDIAQIELTYAPLPAGGTRPNVQVYAR